MRFQNPAHRQALMALGLLGPSEAELPPETLAERLLAKPAALGEVLYIFKQELAQPLSTFGMIEGLLDMLQAQAEAVSSREELEGVLGEFVKLADLGLSYQNYLDDLSLLISYLTLSHADLIQSAPPLQSLLADLRAYTGRLEQLLQVQDPLIRAGLQKIYGIILAKRQTLGL